MARQDKSEGGTRSRRRGSGVLGRALGLLAFLPLASRAPIYARLIFSLLVDERTPASRKALLAGAAGYLLVGRDLVPDGVPDELLAEKIAELGIERSAFDDDMARVRRLTPGPVRKTMRRIPGLIAQAGEAIDHSGVGPRVRAWISKEGSIA